MPVVAKRMKDVPMPKPSAEPVWKGPEEDGVTQSMLARYLSCKERFRVMVIEGLKPTPKFHAPIDFGNMWHVCEEALAGKEDWTQNLKVLCSLLCNKFRFQQEQIEHWYKVCQAVFPLYVDHWAKHPDVRERTPLLQEHPFDVPYRLPSGRVVKLRGKFDSVDLIGTGKAGGVYLQENKTKSGIDEDAIRQQLKFDLQTNVYLIALEIDGRTRWGIGKPPRIAGVRYNVIRRSAHKSVESMLKKLEDDRADKRIGEWFARWKVEVSAADVAKFKRTCLNPVLENLCDDYEWWLHCKVRSLDPFDHSERESFFEHHRPRHFRKPYGIYDPVEEGGFGDVDGYLETGSEVGLVRVTDLFPELNV